ncbi:MAG: hypothetical protein C5B47_02185, partial [Verrucomicrobia bacterium]
ALRYSTTEQRRRRMLFSPFSGCTNYMLQKIAMLLPGPRGNRRMVPICILPGMEISLKFIESLPISVVLLLQ